MNHKETSIVNEFKSDYSRLCSGFDIVNRYSKLPHGVVEFGFDVLTNQDKLTPTGNIILKDYLPNIEKFNADYEVLVQSYYYHKGECIISEKESINLTFSGKITEDNIVFDTFVGPGNEAAIAADPLITPSGETLIHKQSAR